ncbi:hypothetical protein AXG93_2573s1020 [Marchantia polymorpha subsp. ruderalis]|uniref:Uncharacterized protein n=1 Tax=Marchantia polymorpha subsp. ruderalis TaxID=1480154 RepID=A0A176WHK6_MARPO|nr:hypothetical protein AXG93_2573s1020 [Marchantia polymorpha subsp. ruderalis]
MATEILNSEDDEEGGSTKLVSGSGSTEKLEEFAKEKAKLTEALDSEQAQNQILSEELVRQTRSHEGRDGEASHPLSQRAEAELQLVVVEDDRRREADRTKEEMARRVTHCLRGYAHWEVAAQEKLTLRELELRAAGLLTGDSRSRRRVAKKLDSFLSKSRDTMATLETEVELFPTRP